MAQTPRVHGEPLFSPFLMLYLVVEPPIIIITIIIIIRTDAYTAVIGPAYRRGT